MELKDKIKELRMENCLTQEQLAEKLNVSRQTVSKYENGINEPDIDTLKKMCVIFDCSIETLIEVEGKSSKNIKIEKVTKVLFYLIIAFCIFSIFSSFVFLRFLPDNLVMHYDINFNPDRFGSKYEFLALGFIGILPVMLLLLFQYFGHELFEQYRTNKLILNIILLIVELVFNGLIIGFGIYSIENKDLYLINLIVTLVGGLFILLSIFTLPTFNKKPNPTFGYRTSFSLKNKEAWIKLNFCQSISALICSVVLVILGLTVITKYSLFFITLIVASMIPTLIYEIVLRKKYKNENVK